MRADFDVVSSLSREQRQLAEERQARQEAEAACAMMRQVLNEFIRFNMDFVKATIEIFPGWDGTIESNTLDKYKGIEARVEQALALDAGRQTAELLREAIQACKFGTGTESGPDFLSRVAAVVASIGGPVTAAELRAKAAAELAVLAKAKALGWLES
jgi:hypothetical protein